MEERPHDAWTPPESAGGFPSGNEPPSPPPPSGADRTPLPWEEPGRPWLGGFFATIALLFTRPREAFERMPVSGDVLRPFLFALMTGWVGVISQCVWELSMRDMMRTLAPPNAWKGVYDLPTGVWFFVAALGPFLVALGVFLNSVLYHMFLFVVGGAKRGFAATLRVVCYAQVGSVLFIVPFCGGIVGGIWIIVLTIIGLSAAHGISVGRSVLAVCLPILLCCVCIALAALAFGATIMGLLSSFGRQGLTP